MSLSGLKEEILNSLIGALNKQQLFGLGVTGFPEKVGSDNLELWGWDENRTHEAIFLSNCLRVTGGQSLSRANTPLISVGGSWCVSIVLPSSEETVLRIAGKDFW